MKLTALMDVPPWEWPEGTAKVLREALLDERTPEPDRLVAAELAGDTTVIDDALADALLSTLRSGTRSEQVRSRAAISLGPLLETADMEGFDDPDDIPVSEETFHGVQEALRALYLDPEVPKEVRRRVLEASVRAPEPWHGGAVRAAWSSDDPLWRLTGIFCMRFVSGFDGEILGALASKERAIHYEAVVAAGSWELDAAWPVVTSILAASRPDKALLLAAIEAAASIRPDEATEILSDLSASDDEEIAEAVDLALAMAGVTADDDDEEAADLDDAGEGGDGGDPTGR
jgi:hypothetical protein